MKLSALCLALFALVACGSKAKPPAGPTDDTAPAWADMNRAQRLEHMKEKVLPHMKAKFTAFDVKYAEMNCKTCHGASAEDGTFKMPNPALPKLDFAKDPATYTEQQQKIGRFMGTVVVPEMATLLGTTPYDPATQQGFGCTACHTLSPD